MWNYLSKNIQGTVEDVIIGAIFVLIGIVIKMIFDFFNNKGLEQYKAELKLNDHIVPYYISAIKDLDTLTKIYESELAEYETMDIRNESIGFKYIFGKTQNYILTLLNKHKYIMPTTINENLKLAYLEIMLLNSELTKYIKAHSNGVLEGGEYDLILSKLGKFNFCINSSLKIMRIGINIEKKMKIQKEAYRESKIMEKESKRKQKERIKHKTKKDLYRQIQTDIIIMNEIKNRTEDENNND